MTHFSRGLLLSAAICFILTLLSTHQVQGHSHPRYSKAKNLMTTKPHNNARNGQYKSKNQPFNTDIQANGDLQDRYPQNREDESPFTRYFFSYNLPKNLKNSSSYNSRLPSRLTIDDVSAEKTNVDSNFNHGGNSLINVASDPIDTRNFQNDNPSVDNHLDYMEKAEKKFEEGK